MRSPWGPSSPLCLAWERPSTYPRFKGLMPQAPKCPDPKIPQTQEAPPSNAGGDPAHPHTGQKSPDSLSCARTPVTGAAALEAQESGGFPGGGSGSAGSARIARRH